MRRPAGDDRPIASVSPTTAKSSTVAIAEARPLTGITLKVLSVTIFVCMSTCIKAVGTIPPGQIVFYRSFFAMFPLLVMLAWRRELATAFRTSHPFSHVARGLVGVFSMGLSFYGLTRLPLPDAIMLNYAQPLMVVALSALFMGEVVRIFRWSAVTVGLAGVVVIAWPNLTMLTAPAAMDAQQASGVVAILCAAALSAVAVILVRRLVRTERSATIVMWFSATASVVGLATWPFGWAALSGTQVALLVSAGFCGGIAQILMTECYRHADMSTIAPFEYTSMILSIVIGFFVFGDLPTAYTLVGGSIVVGSGIFIIWRERRLGLQQGAARRFVRPEG